MKRVQTFSSPKSVETNCQEFVTC